MKHVLLATVAALSLAGGSVSAATNTNALSGFSGMGDAITINGQTYPQVVVSPGAASNPANVADGVVQWIPGQYDTLIYNQRAVIDITLQNFTSAAVPPLCFLQFDYSGMMDKVASLQTLAGDPTSNPSQYASPISNVFANYPYLDFERSLAPAKLFHVPV